ncbi:MAG: DNA replication and repair protein RecF [Opitutales bacterium]
MRITHFRASNFRNIGFADIPLESQYVWVCGINGQGKSNLLEGLSLINAMRSFRTAKLANMIKFGEVASQLIINTQDDGDSEVEINLTKAKNTVAIDSYLCKSLSEFIGKYPLLVMSADDLALLKLAPSVRRKFIDMHISSLDLEYFVALKNYHRALLNRNALLKDERSSDAEFIAFEVQIAQNAEIIARKREAFLKDLNEELSSLYTQIASLTKEKVALVYKDSASILKGENYLQKLADNRAKDKILGSTSIGIHRDDMLMLLAGKVASEYASDGQQRSIVLALKLAQLKQVANKKNTLPVLLCDDILGELDDYRKDAFWTCIDKDLQVIVSSTNQNPEAKYLKIKVENGKYE